MSNIKLSDKSVPDWAKVVPEKVWKTNLIEKLSMKRTDLFQNQNQSE